MKSSEEFLKRLIPWLCVYMAMVFVGLSGGTAVFDSSVPLSLGFAAAAIALMAVAASFLKG